MLQSRLNRFKLNLSGAVLELTRGDLTLFDGDAIVNAANERMLGGGGVDGAIHRAAGRGLLQACLQVEELEPGVRCPTGEARITAGFHLPARFVIHTVGPVYEDAETSASDLKAAYSNSLKLANAKGLKSVAFPAISCGVYGYPFEEAAAIALSTVCEDACKVEKVHFFLHDLQAWRAWNEEALRTLEPLENEPTKCVGEKDDVKADTCPVYASPDDLGVEGNTCDDNVHRLTDAGPQADQVPSTSAPGTGCGVGGLAAVSGCEI